MTGSAKTASGVKPGPINSAPLQDAIAAQLASLAIDPARREQLGQGLFERVRCSAEAQMDLTTLRREDGLWMEAFPGLRHRLLRRDAGVCIELVRLDANVLASWPEDALAHEILLLEGSLALETSGASSETLPRYAHCVRKCGATGRLRALDAGALLYVRHRLAGLELLEAREAHWWWMAQVQSGWTGGPEAPWGRVCDGVAGTALYSEGDVVSGLMRVAPGAAIPDHHHEIDEDCYVLEGDLFFGDILMRAGDYQKAAAGGQHADCHSDVGAVFYFHGVLPPGISAGAA